MNPWKNIDGLSYSDIRALQNKKLQHFIGNYLYPFSPFYRKLFDDHKINPQRIRTVEDLRYIPFSSKVDLISKENTQKYKDFILQPDEAKIKQFWPKSKLVSMAWDSAVKGKQYVHERMVWEFRPVFMTFTTGTTSTPIPFMYSNYDIENLRLSGSRMVSLFDLSEEDRMINAFPFAPHLAFWQVFFGGLSSNVFGLSTGGGKVLGTEGNMTALLRSQPAVLFGVPSYIYHLVRFAQQKGHQLSFIKKIVLGAAKVTVAYKEKLLEMLEAQGAKNVCIFGTYGFTEARSAWSECPTDHRISSGYHLYPDKEIFEVIDPATGEVKGEGQDGELVYTALDSRASSVLRFRTGDFVKGGITYQPCPHCGRTTLRLSSDISRLSDTKDLQLSKVKGTLVNLSHFGSVLNDIAEVEEWQIEIRKHNNDPFDVDEVVVYVSPKAGISESKLCTEIKEKLVGSCEISPNDIKLIALDEMIKRLELETANKEKRILDNRPKT